MAIYLLDNIGTIVTTCDATRFKNILKIFNISAYFLHAHSTISPSTNSAQFSPTFTIGFAPEARKDLKRAVDECLQLSPVGDCCTEKYSAIGNWDVSRISDMGWMFYIGRGSPNMLNQDILKWVCPTLPT